MKEGIPGKQELNHTHYLGLTPLLHSTFFTLTLINPQAINEIYHWHQLERGENELAKTRGEGEWGPSHKQQGARAMPEYGSQLFELIRPRGHSKATFLN